MYLAPSGAAPWTRKSCPTTAVGSLAFGVEVTGSLLIVAAFPVLTAVLALLSLDRYVGSTQIHLIGQDSWAGYPTWRRENGKGRFREHISDATIQFEMGALNAVMNFAITKRLVPASHRFEGRPKLKTMRRDEFTIEEYRKLHSVGRKWIRAATTPQGIWYRTMCYNFMLIMCNTGMRPPEAKNLDRKSVV